MRCGVWDGESKSTTLNLTLDWPKNPIVNIRAEKFGQGKNKHPSAESGVQFQAYEETWEQRFPWQLLSRPRSRRG